MNLTGRAPYLKATRRKPKRNVPTMLDRKYWALVAAVGCIVAGSSPCEGRITIHHCGTGAGGRKDHKKVIPLCWGHHQGAQGIDGKRMSKREWQDKYGSEEKLLKRLKRRLAACNTAE
jgi:hypothetical protein